MNLKLKFYEKGKVKRTIVLRNVGADEAYKFTKENKYEAIKPFLEQGEEITTLVWNDGEDDITITNALDVEDAIKSGTTIQVKVIQKKKKMGRKPKHNKHKHRKHNKHNNRTTRDDI